MSRKSRPNVIWNVSRLSRTFHKTFKVIILQELSDSAVDLEAARTRLEQAAARFALEQAKSGIYGQE